MQPNDSNLGKDLLWGVRAIAREIGRTERQTYHMIARGELPVQKVGGRHVGARSRLRALFLPAGDAAEGK
ncbi:hypothetical protein ABY43_16355 [Rhizobium giardinii]